MTDQVEESSWYKRFAWMIVIWSASVAALGVVAYLIRLWLQVQ